LVLTGWNPREFCVRDDRTGFARVSSGFVSHFETSRR
jgi:hypothetical protein